MNTEYSPRTHQWDMRLGGVMGVKYQLVLIFLKFKVLKIVLKIESGFRSGLIVQLNNVE